MSTLIMSQCWPLQMPPTPKSVLISLADNANDQGVCWPSIATIAQRTCFSERAIQGAIKWLEQHGIVRADRSNGRHTSYLITPGNYAQPPQEVHPRSKCTPAGDAPTPAGGAPVPPQQVRQPPQEVPSNRKEPSEEPSRNRQRRGRAAPDDFDPLQYLLDKGVTSKVAKDWMKLRKGKKLEAIETAFEGVVHEASLAGMSLQDVLKTCCERGWGGFKAKWLEAEAAGKGGGAWWATPESKLAKAQAVGVGPALRGESDQAWTARIQAAIENGGRPPEHRPAPTVSIRDPQLSRLEAPVVVSEENRRAALAAAGSRKVGGA